MSITDDDTLEQEYFIRLGNRVAERAVWQDITDLAIDLAEAIKAALDNGSLTRIGACVIYWHYVEGLSLGECADRLHLSHDQTWRLHRQALQAIRDTGLLKGYSAEK